jgi:peptidoglycan/LPS O-acetylase OafA/YrhL
MSNQPAHGKIQDIECLRAFAILFTLLAHFRFMYDRQPSWVDAMDRNVAFWCGVDLFFVISGFVIAKSLIPQILDPQSSRITVLCKFWYKRAFRLLPSAWAWAGIGTIVIALFYREQLYRHSFDLVAALLQVYNWHSYACQIGQAKCSYMAVGVYWSLSLEEQFYIVLPIMLALLRGRMKWVTLALFFIGVPMHTWSPVFANFFRWEAFCVGILLAWLHTNRSAYEKIGDEFFSRLGGFRLLLGWMCLITLPVLAGGHIIGPSYPLIALSSGFLVLMASYDRNFLGLPSVVRRLLSYIGGRSYSAYLVHSSIFLVIRHYMPQDDKSPLAHLLIALAATVVVFIISELNYHLIEARFRRS